MSTASTGIQRRPMFAPVATKSKDAFSPGGQQTNRMPIPIGFDGRVPARSVLIELRFERSLADYGFPSAVVDSIAFELQRASNQSKAKVLELRLRESLLSPKADWDADALERTAEPLFEALIELGPGAIDLRGLPQDGVNGMHLALVLRGTFAVRHQTPGWHEALRVAEAALRRQGLQPEEALMGLF